MEIDIEQLGTGLRAGSALLDCQVCVVGAGIAGLVLAHKLASEGVDVLVLEAGGRSDEGSAPEGDHQSFRALGGTSLVWGGQLLPVLNTRDWPVRDEELQRHRPEVEELLGVDSLPYEAERFFEGMRRQGPDELWQVPGLVVRVSKFAPFAHRNLGSTLGKALLRDRRARVALHTRAVEVTLTADANRATGVRACTRSGKAIELRARQVVLAAGTVESCRLLLASRSVSAEGVGNQHDQVGRNVHDHLTIAVANLNGRSRDSAVDAYRPWIVGGVGGTVHSLKLEAGPGRPPGMAHFTFEEPEGTGIAALRDVLKAKQQGARFPPMTRLPELPRAINDLFSLYACARMEQRRFVSPRARVALRLNVAQQEPSGSRVRLGSERDRLGQLAAALEWKVTSEDQRALRTWASLLHEYFAPRGFAEADGAQWNPQLLAREGEIEGIESAQHLMGGACMGTDPRASVVDGDLNVQGVENLYVASAAVFPDGRAQLPTLTLMALCLRLAERLRVAEAEHRL